MGALAAVYVAERPAPIPLKNSGFLRWINPRGASLDKLAPCVDFVSCFTRMQRFGRIIDCSPGNPALPVAHR